MREELIISILARAAGILGRPVGYARWGTPSRAYDLRHHARRASDPFLEIRADKTVRGQSRRVEYGEEIITEIRDLTRWTSADVGHLWVADPEAARVVERLADEWYDAQPSLDVARIAWVEDTCPPLSLHRTAHLVGGGAVFERRQRFAAPIGAHLHLAGQVHGALIASPTVEVLEARARLVAA